MTDRGIESCPWVQNGDCHVICCPALWRIGAPGAYGRTVSSKPEQVSWYSVAYNDSRCLYLPSYSGFVVSTQ